MGIYKQDQIEELDREREHSVPRGWDRIEGGHESYSPDMVMCEQHETIARLRKVIDIQRETIELTRDSLDSTKTVADTYEKLFRQAVLLLMEGRQYVRDPFLDGESEFNVWYEDVSKLVKQFAPRVTKAE